MKAVGTAMLLVVLAFVSASCASPRPLSEPVIEKDATISREREDAEQIERTERKQVDPWKY